MRKLRRLIERYERAFMLGLVVVVLVIFTVTGEIMDWLRPSQGGGWDPKAIAGAYSILPGGRKDVSYGEYEGVRAEYARLADLRTGGQGQKVRPSSVWTYLVLLDAARREGITVSNAAVRQLLGYLFPSELLNDRPRYKEVIQRRYGVSHVRFEEMVRNLMISQSFRAVYQQSFQVAPPTTREELVKQYAGQKLEFARVSWLALDAGSFLEEAEAELDASTDPDQVLRDFYEKDPAIKAEPFLFRHPRRYDFELIYTIHKKVTEKTYQRIEDLFEKTWPDEVDTDRLEQVEKELRDYYGQYRDRLLEDEGSSWEAIKKEKEETGENESEEEILPTPEREEALAGRGWDLVKHRVDREIRVRTLYRFLKHKAGRNESESIRKLFDELAANDDPENPICSTKPDEGLIVYRRPETPLSTDEIDDLEDSGEKFTHHMRFLITRLSDQKLPKLGLNAEVMNARGFGRTIYRLIAMERERRKTFDDLTEAEREAVFRKFFLPTKARERAAERLEDLRKRLEESEDPAKALADAGADLAVPVRLVEDEWITARDRYMPPPVQERFWHDDYVHMRDRDFLRRRLADLFAADRVKRQLEAGSVLEIQTDARNEADDPGASYLVLLLERRKPSAETMPMEDLETYVNLARRQRTSRERMRWEDDFLRLKTQFEMEFFGDMQKAIEEELAARK